MLYIITLQGLTFNGFENITQVSLNDINMQYNVVDSANAQTACQNMLFMGNVNNPEIEYKRIIRFVIKIPSTP